MPTHDNVNDLYYVALGGFQNLECTIEENVDRNPIKKVIFNDPATIVIWTDGTKTIVKCSEDDIYDPEKWLAMAICKHYLTDVCGIKSYQYALKKWLPDDRDEQTVTLYDILRTLLYNV